MLSVNEDDDDDNLSSHKCNYTHNNRQVNINTNVEENLVTYTNSPCETLFIGVCLTIQSPGGAKTGTCSTVRRTTDGLMIRLCNPSAPIAVEPRRIRPVCRQQCMAYNNSRHGDVKYEPGVSLVCTLLVLARNIWDTFTHVCTMHMHAQR